MKKQTPGIHVTIYDGLSKMPPEVRNRILTKVQARAFLRGYIQLMYEITHNPADDQEYNSALLLMSGAEARLHELD